MGELSSPSFQCFFWNVFFLNFPIWGDCCILLHQMGQFHGWFWRVGKTKKIRAKMRVRNSSKIHPRIYSEIHDDNLKIHLEFTARDSSRDGCPCAVPSMHCGSALNSFLAAWHASPLCVLAAIASDLRPWRPGHSKMFPGQLRWRFGHLRMR